MKLYRMYIKTITLLCVSYAPLALCAQADAESTSVVASEAVVIDEAIANERMFRWAKQPQVEVEKQQQYRQQMQQAYDNPEYLLHDQVDLPVAGAIEDGDAGMLRLTMREAILLSLRYNPNVLNAEIDRILQRYQLRVANSAFEWNYALAGSFKHSGSESLGIAQPRSTSLTLNPKATLNLSAGGSVTLEAPTNFNGNELYPTARATFKQPLLKGAGESIAQADLRDAYDTEQNNIFDLESSIIGEVNSVIAAFRTLIGSNRSLEIDTQALEFAQKRYENTKAEIAVGRKARSQLIEEERNIASLRLSLLRSIDNHEQNQQKLLTIIGLDPRLKIDVPKTVTVTNFKVPDLEMTIDYALKNNIAYQQQLLAYKRAKRSLMKAMDNARWQMDLELSAEVGTSGGTSGRDAGIPSLFNGRNHSQSVGLSFTAPLSNFSQRQEIISQRINLEKLRIGLAASERALRTEVKDILTSLKIQIESIKATEIAVKASQQSYLAALRKQAVGRESPLNVTISQDNLIRSQRNLIDVKITYLNLVTRLEALLATTLEKWDIELRYT